MSINKEKTIFRYDNSHPTKGHSDDHHKHELDLETGKETRIWIGRERWPLMSEVFDEITKWHSEHYNMLQNPNKCPLLEPHLERQPGSYDFIKL